MLASVVARLEAAGLAVRGGSEGGAVLIEPKHVPGHTPQAPAHSLSVPPAHACPARPARTSPSGPGHPSGPMALREGARPQDLRDRPCDPSPSRPSRARRVPPRLGHAPGPLAPRGIMPGIPRLPSTCLLADNIVAETRCAVMPTVV